jgi:hypothetical protein
VAIKADGGRLATMALAGAENIDWEDLDAFDLNGKHYLMVADTGDNGGIRKQLTLYVVEEPARVRDGGSLKPAWTINFRWPGRRARLRGERGRRRARRSAADFQEARAPGGLPRAAASRQRRRADRRAARHALGHLAAEPGRAEEESRVRALPLRVTGADLSSNGRVLAVLNYHSCTVRAQTPPQDWEQV